METPKFKACYHCKPPKRTPGCHGTCKEYLEEKAAWDEQKKQIDKEKEKEIFLASIERKRSLRI